MMPARVALAVARHRAAYAFAELGHRRQIRAAWAAARTPGDVGNLTAAWLDGTLGGFPGYASGYGPPHPETDQLRPALAAANRAGYLTHQSQPGQEATPGYDGDLWWQRAFVDGLAVDSDVVSWLGEEALASGLVVITGVAGWRYDDTRDMPVTASEQGFVHTAVGGILPRRELAVQYEGMVPNDLVRQLVRLRQVTLVDPDWGRTDRLGPLLQRFAARPTAYLPLEDTHA